MYSFFTFHTRTSAENCHHQLLVATIGAFILTSVSTYESDGFVFEGMHIYLVPFDATKALKILKLFIVDISVYKSVVGTL